MIECGIDEYTIVFQSTDFLDIVTGNIWIRTANQMIDKIILRLNLELIFGAKKKSSKTPLGYTDGYEFEDNNYYLNIAFHTSIKEMGVVVRFSARSLSYYTKNYNVKAYELLNKLVDRDYTFRLSRVDIYMDYIDEEFSVSDIHRDFAKKEVCVAQIRKDKDGNNYFQKSNLKETGYFEENITTSLHLGSKKSPSFIRIYDKRHEQFSKNGSELLKAKSSNSWIRFEAVYRDEFAHQITDLLINLNNDDDYINLLVNLFLQKYSFLALKSDGTFNGLMPYTRKLHNTLKKQEILLSSPDTRNNDLIKSYLYLIRGSGLIKFTYIIKRLWGDKAIQELFNEIVLEVENYKANDDCTRFLKRYAKEYKMEFKDFKDLIDKNKK